MKVGQYEFTISRNGETWLKDICGVWHQQTDASVIERLRQIKHIYTSKKYDRFDRNAALDDITSILNDNMFASVVVNDTNPNADIRQIAKTTIQSLINFFTEFNFEPNFRFINTFAKYCMTNTATNAKAYVHNYFNLTDHQHATSIEEKTRSTEFDDIISSLASIPSNKIINTRFKVYYGSQGTGKTTQAMKETGNNCIVCHSAMLPSDLMEDFKFEDGHPAFKASALQNAMVEGKKIVLDEINLLPFESLRFLQSMLDGKTEFIHKGNVIHIKDGFQIIGTMNLTVNGCTFSLPEPLVDRACELRKYKLTATTLIGALL